MPRSPVHVSVRYVLTAVLPRRRLWKCVALTTWYARPLRTWERKYGRPYAAFLAHKGELSLKWELDQ